MRIWWGSASVFLLLLGACVPKQQFEDQEAQLRDAKEKLQTIEAQAAECDPNAFVQLKEQSQSLDLLTQELVDRNTELSKEVARLRAIETSCKASEQGWTGERQKADQEFTAKEERIRRTYEDLIKELRAEISRLEGERNKAKDALKAKETPKPIVRDKPKVSPSPKVEKPKK